MHWEKSGSTAETIPARSVITRWCENSPGRRVSSLPKATAAHNFTQPYRTLQKEALGLAQSVLTGKEQHGCVQSKGYYFRG